MNRDRTEELIQLALDHSATESETNELQSLLSEDAEAAKLEQGLRAVKQALDEVPAVDPPPSLRTRIMEAVRQQGRTMNGVAPISIASRRRYEILKIAAALVIGVLLGVFIGPQLSDANIDQSQLTGTMSNPVSNQAQPKKAAEPIPIELSSLQGEIRPLRNEGGLVVDMRLSSEDEREITISYDSSMAEFRGLSKGDQATVEVSSSPGTLILKSAGPMAISLEFDSMVSTPLEVTVQQRGQTVFGVSLLDEKAF